MVAQTRQVIVEGMKVVPPGVPVSTGFDDWVSVGCDKI